MSYDWDGVITYNEQQAKVRKQFIDVAAFLDEMADSLEMNLEGATVACAADCRAMAKKLRGET